MMKGSYYSHERRQFMESVVKKYFESKGVEVTEKQIEDVCSYCQRKEIGNQPANIVRFLNEKPALVRALLLIGNKTYGNIH